MNYRVAGCDLISNRAEADNKTEPTENLSTLSSDLWKELRTITSGLEKVFTPLIGEGTFKRILDALPLGPAAKTKEAEWTVAIDLTTDFGHGHGVPDRMKQLRELAAKTKDKDVTIIAQAAYPDKDAEGKPSHRLETYVIKDGAIKCVEKAPSKGYGQDVEKLLAFATKNHPSKQLGLIIDSHGAGNEGLVGDTGRVSVREFIDSVRAGLKDSGKTKLDLIDFDCCLMGQNGVLNRIKDIALDVVAAEETESTEGQNLIPPLEHLLDKPKTSGRELAKDLIRETRNQGEVREQQRGKVPVESLSYFNLREYEGFAAKLDTFGEKLSEALKDSGSRQAIETAIDESKSFGSKGGFLNLFFGIKTRNDRRDLKDFSEKVVAGIDSGKIKDADGSLKKCAQDVLDTRKKLVEAYYGHGEYAGQGGLSVFLPGRELRDTQKEARGKNPAGRMALMTEPGKFAEVNKDATSRNAMLSKLETQLREVRPRTLIFLSTGVQGVEKETKAIEDAASAFTKAGTDEDRKKAFDVLHKAAENMEKVDHFDKLRRKTAVELRVNSAQEYSSQLVGNGKSGWSRFRVELRDGTR